MQNNFVSLLEAFLDVRVVITENGQKMVGDVLGVRKIDDRVIVKIKVLNVSGMLFNYAFDPATDYDGNGTLSNSFYSVKWAGMN